MEKNPVGNIRLIMSTKDPRQFYNDVMPEKFGADYEHKRWHETPIKEAGYRQTLSVVEQFLRDLEMEPKSILEIGPGAGTWTKRIIARFPKAELTLLDISKEMLERATIAIGEGKAALVESDVLAYEPEQTFDLLFSSRVIEYIDRKRDLTRKFAELLAPGGVGFVITKMPHYERERMLGREVSMFHQGQIAPEAFRGMLLEEGFEVTSAFPVTVSVPLLRSAFMNQLAGWVLRKFSLNPFSAMFTESYCIAFRKPAAPNE
jgi:trans-aconitate methyltransferase